MFLWLETFQLILPQRYVWPSRTWLLVCVFIGLLLLWRTESLWLSDHQLRTRWLHSTELKHCLQISDQIVSIFQSPPMSSDVSYALLLERLFCIEAFCVKCCQSAIHPQTFAHEYWPKLYWEKNKGFTPWWKVFAIYIYIYVGPLKNLLQRLPIECGWNFKLRPRSRKSGVERTCLHMTFKPASKCKCPKAVWKLAYINQVRSGLVPAYCA